MPAAGPPIAWVRSPDDPGRQVPLGGGNDPLEDFRAIAWIGMQAAGALEHAHRREVLHRDIKPSNVMLDDSGRVLLADFGLAKVVGQGDLTDRTDLLGTLRYMAPERFQGWCDPRSDVYGLGLTLYELLTKRPAFPALDRTELIRMILDSSPLRPRRLRPEIPKDLEAIVLRAIEPEPSDRYSSARELAEDLSRWDRGQRPVSRPSRKLRRFRRWARANPLQTAAYVVLSLSAIGASVACGVLWRRSEANYRSEATARALGEEQLRLAFEAINEVGADQARDVYVSDRQSDPSQEERLSRIATFYQPLVEGLRTRQPLDDISRLTLYRCLDKMGRLELMRHRLDEAEAAFREARELEAALAKSDRTRDVLRVDRASLGFGLATLAQQRGDEKVARRQLEAIIGEMGKVSLDEPGASTLLSVRADAYMQLANLASTEGFGDRAIEHRRRCLADFLAAHGAESSDWRFQLKIASAKAHLGDALLGAGERRDGRVLLDEAVEAIRDIVRARPDLRVPPRVFVHILTRYADAETPGDIPHAIEIRREALQVYDRIPRPFGDTDAEKFHHARNGLQLGTLLIYVKPEEAKALLSRHLELMSEIPADFPELSKNATGIGAAWVNYGSMLGQEHREDDAIRCFRKGEEWLVRGVDQPGANQEARPYLRNARHNLAIALMAKHDYAASAKAWAATVPLHVECGMDPTPLIVGQVSCLIHAGEGAEALRAAATIDTTKALEPAPCLELACGFTHAAVQEHRDHNASADGKLESRLSATARLWMDRYLAVAGGAGAPMADRAKSAQLALQEVEFPSMPFAR